VGRQIHEQYCSGSDSKTKIYTCPNGCSGGACKQVPVDEDFCRDSDGGRSYYKYGNVRYRYANGVEGVSYDYCRDKETLVENYCKSQKHATDYHECTYGCKSAVCLQKPVDNEENVYLGRSFGLNIGETAKVVDHFNMMVKLNNVYPNIITPEPRPIPQPDPYNCGLTHTLYEGQSGVYYKDGVRFEVKTKVIGMTSNQIAVVMNINGADTKLLKIGDQTVVGNGAIAISNIVQGGQYEDDAVGRDYVSFCLEKIITPRPALPKRTLYEGQTATYTVDGDQYEVRVDVIGIGYDGTARVILSINGDPTKELAVGQSDHTMDAFVVIKKLTLNSQIDEGARDSVQFTIEEANTEVATSSGNQISANVVASGSGDGGSGSATTAAYELKVAPMIYPEKRGATLTVTLPSGSAKRTILHRTHRYCDSKQPVENVNDGEEQVFPVGEGTSYWNFKCKNRYQEQCHDDGSFDTYYDEWCEYIGDTSKAVTMNLKVGQSKNVFGSKVTLLGINRNTAKLIVEKESHQEGAVDIGIVPRTSTVERGEVAKYEIVVKDKREQTRCGGSTRCGSTPISYKISVIGLPFGKEYQRTVTLSEGQKKSIKLTVYTNKRVMEERLASLEKMAAGSGSHTELIAEVQGIEFYDVEEGRQWCINNWDGEDQEEYASCTARIQVHPVDEIDDSAAIESDSIAVTERAYPAPYYIYRFAVKATSPNNRASDVAYGTLRINRNVVPPVPIPPDDDEIKLQLYPGWNLVSLSGNKLTRFIDTTCSERNKLVSFIYIKEQGRYYTLSDAKELLDNDFEEYLSRHAFWVYSYSECELIVGVEKYIGYNELSLSEGWNMIPVTEDMVGKQLSEVVSNCDFSRVYSWDSQNNEWVKIDLNDVITHKMMYKGLVVKVNNFCQLGGSLTIDNPPEFPDEA